jgi:integrase
MVRRPLTSAQVDALKKHGTHWVAPPGLYLQVKPNGARSWLLRYTALGKAHWHGLGAARDVGLKEARQAAEDMRTDIRRGRDPVAERRAAKAAVAPRSVPTFEWCAAEYIASHEAGWKNSKHRDQWESTLKTHAGPILGKLAVDRIGVDEVYGVLDPIWRTLPETASRLRGRIESVLGWAAAKGYRDGENPARWKGGALEHLLPAIGRVRKVQPRASVPYAECPPLMTKLAALDSVSSRALRFTILTAVRTSEALEARWTEFDLAARTWTIPAERMKAGVEHTVPLTDEAIALLGDPAKTGFIFPGARPRKPLSNMAMLMVLRGIRDDGSTVHGFRSSFRTWAAESGHPREVAEMCLAHATGSAVELAYQRSDYLAQRRIIIDGWARFLAS